MLKSWSEDILEAWVVVFEELIIETDYKNIEKLCTNSIVFLSSNTNPSSSRYISGKMISIVAKVQKNINI